MTRLVLIDSKKYKVFENKVCVAEYDVVDASKITKEEIEEIRVANYPSKA